MKKTPLKNKKITKKAPVSKGKQIEKPVAG